jgi:rRNA pseudouridine-1189 N-methylase Emg1 (Nep1/Mra1 family)
MFKNINNFKCIANTIINTPYVLHLKKHSTVKINKIILLDNTHYSKIYIKKNQKNDRFEMLINIY